MEKIKSAVDKVIHPHSHEERAHPTTTTPLSTVATPLYSPTETMKAVEWHGKEDVRVGVRPKPLVTCPDDVVVRVTSTTICGSDLHLYYDQVPGVQVMKSGDIIGHEAMGIVDSIGPEVKSLKVGDRVVISCAIACGQCSYCQKGMFSCCDTTNPDGQMEKLYGHRTAALFGYSHLTGQYDGCQAEFVRVPHADFNCLKVTNQLEDEMLLFLSDVLCTGWHGNELAEVKAGDVVAVWGCGPIGLAALAWAKFRGASKLIAIDDVPYRLAIAQDKIGASIINFKDQDVIATIQTLVPGGPDCCIDCAGFRFPTSLGHRLQRTLRLETDALDIIAEMVKTVRKGGRIALIGDYFGLGNNFPIGAFMEKGLQMRGGQVFVQKYWHTLLSYIESGKFDPRFLVSHVMPLDQAPEAYKLFSNQLDNSVKIVLKPTGTTSAQPAVLPVR